MDLALIGSDDGKLSFGYASFKGRRASMEDFYDTKLSSIDEKTISLFGIFDGLKFSAILCRLIYCFPCFANYVL